MKKRILSMFIAVLMVALMIPFSALTTFAADEPITINSIEIEAVKPAAGVSADVSTVKIKSVNGDEALANKVSFVSNKLYYVEVPSLDPNEWGSDWSKFTGIFEKDKIYSLHFTVQSTTNTVTASCDVTVTDPNGDVWWEDVATLVDSMFVTVDAITTASEFVEYTKVSTFAQLVSAVNEDKTNIKLMADITHTVPMELPDQHRLVFDGNKEYVLDLNGYNLSVRNRDNEYFSGTISFIKVMGTSKLTVKNGFIEFGNYKAKSREDYGSVQVTDSAELITENVAFESYRAGCTIILEKQAKATLNGGSVQALNGYAVYAHGTSALTLDYGVTLRTTVGDGSNTVNNFGYGSLYFHSSGDLTVYGAYFKSGVQVHPTQIDEFDVTKKEVKIDGTKLTKKIYDGDELPNPSEYDYYWYQGQRTAYAIFTTETRGKFALEISVIDTERTFPITVTNGVAKVGGVTVTEAKYGETVTLEANAPESGYSFTGWSGNHETTNNAATTTIIMPYDAVKLTANYGKTPISNVLVSVTQPVVGGCVADVTASANGNTKISSVQWYRVQGGSSYPMDEREMFLPGMTYRVSVGIQATNGFFFNSAFTATLNGQAATATYQTLFNGSVTYTFTAISSNPFAVYYTDSFIAGVGSTISLDVTKMANESSDFNNALLTENVEYQWYQNGKPIAGATSESYKIESAENGDNFVAKITAGNVVAYSSAKPIDEKILGEITLLIDEPSVGQKLTDLFIDSLGGITVLEEETTWQEYDSTNGYWVSITNENAVFEADVKYRVIIDVEAKGDYALTSNTTVNADGRKTSVSNFGTLLRVWVTFDAVSGHIHTYDDTFKTDELGHWKECTDSACPAQYKGAKDKTVHTYSEDFKFDAENHWKECACGAKTENGAHSGGTATCTAKAKCEICNADYGSVATHTHGTEWKNDADNHWNECACGDKANVAAHADANSDEKCDTCGKDMPKADDPSAPTPDLPNTNTDKETNATDDESKSDDETDAPVEKGCGGCGSSAALSALAIVAVVGSALVIKKKED